MEDQTELAQAADDAVAALRAVATNGVIPEVRAAASLAVLVIIAARAVAPLLGAILAAQPQEATDA